jgi:integrase
MVLRTGSLREKWVCGPGFCAESAIAAMLGHAAGSVTSRYVHHLDSVLIAAAYKVARTIHGMMAGA